MSQVKSICLVGGEDVHKRIQLSQYLINANFKVTIIGTSTQDFPKNISYITYNLNRSLSPIADYKTMLWYKKFFNDNHFDIIHTFDTKPAFLLPLALLNTETPITRTITGLGTIFMSNTMLSYVLKKVYRTLHYRVRNRVFKTIFQNTDDEDIYLDFKLINSKNHSLIYSSGIELSDYTQQAPRNNKQFTFICVARLVYEKGIVNLLEAARLCKDKGENYKILLVGPLEENSNRLNQNILNQYNDVVDFLGEQQDVENLLLTADAFILPTFREGFSRVLLEAAASGLPIVSTNVTGVREFVRNNKEALLVEANNSKDLSNAMIELASNKTLANKLAENALKRVETFSLKNVAKQYITIFEEAINHS